MKGYEEALHLDESSKYVVVASVDRIIDDGILNGVGIFERLFQLLGI